MSNAFVLFTQRPGGFFSTAVVGTCKTGIWMYIACFLSRMLKSIINERGLHHISIQCTSAALYLPDPVVEESTAKYSITSEIPAF